MHCFSQTAAVYGALYLVVGFGFSGSAAASSGAADTGEAFYFVSPAAEGQTPPVTTLRLVVTGRERTEGGEYVWWEFTAGRPEDGGSFGVRILSERAPMTSPEGPGRIERYIYRDTTGRVLEYRDSTTGKALLPVVQFEESFLPRAARDAVYEGGFASSGAFLGHVLQRAPAFKEPARVSFENPIALNLRTDLIIGMQSAVVFENHDGHKQTPFKREQYARMIAAGANYFGPGNDQLAWMQAQPVFYRATPSFPDSYYRANWVPHRMFIDEPMVRMGWAGGLPANCTGPQQMAESLRQRVASHYILSERLHKAGNGNEGGTLSLVVPHAPSWETDYWSAWYQLAGGASGIIHEGRYVEHGYGWEPKDLFGQEGLDGLRPVDQFNCINAFLRGAARAFDGDWGISVYPEGDPKLRLPALIHAYDMGARYLWFWSWPPMEFELEEELTRGIIEHAAKHPRGDIQKATRAGKVGVVFPPGYAVSFAGVWGMQREQRSPGGASYGDIAAAGIWEGILCSRKGIPFDFLVDEPHIRDLGYERLVRVREDGRLEASPPWPEARPARELALAIEEGELPGIRQRVKGEPDYTARRAAAITIDGRLDDWKDVEWISLTSDEHGFPDPIWLEVPVVNDLSRPEWQMKFTTYMGMTFTQITEELEKKYTIEGLHGRGVVVTKLEPGSPAAKAGILEGDVLRHTGTWPIDWEFQMHQRLAPFNNAKYDGRVIPFRVRRSGRYRFGGEGDLGAQVALAVDDANLYVAARVTDDTHSQLHHRGDYWKGDCLQIGLDTTLERREYGYGEEDNEFGFVLQDGRPFAWRWHGRRGQPLGEMPHVPVKIRREEGVTLYEAAVPLKELTPLAPDLWLRAGFNITVNDSDGTIQRKGRLELRPKNMTMIKRTAGFAALAFAPSPRQEKLSAAVLWRKRATEQDGTFRAIIATRSPQARAAKVVAVLTSLDSPETPPVSATLPIKVSAEAREHSLTIRTASPPGRYDLRIQITDEAGGVAAEDHQPVYVYPR